MRIPVSCHSSQQSLHFQVWIHVHCFPRVLQARQWGLNHFQMRAFSRQGSPVELNSPPCGHTHYFLSPFIILVLDLTHVVGAKALTTTLFEDLYLFLDAASFASKLYSQKAWGWRDKVKTRDSELSHLMARTFLFQPNL